MKRILSWTLASVLAVLVPVGTAYAVTLFSGGGLDWDITETSFGYVGDGEIDAYDAMYYLNVNGVDYRATGAATTSLGGRQYEMTEIPMGSLMVRRMAYVPSTGGNWIRYIDVLRNPTGADIMATVQIHGSLGADSVLEITGSSTGDVMATTADDWFTTDDNNASAGDTPTGHVMQGPNGSTRANEVVAMVSGFDDILRWTFNVTVPAGGEAAILTYGIQETARADTITTAQLLASPACVPAGGADPLLGMDATMRGNVVNFALAGAPIPCFDSVDMAPEGDAIMVDVTVTDFEMDPGVTWSWDIDDDGTFGEMTDATSITVPMGTTDGPGQRRVGIETSDGTNTRQAYRFINISNVDPTITSMPRTEAAIRREYQYQVTVDEPAGTMCGDPMLCDPIRYVLTSRPTGMMVDDTGLITWTPTTDQRNMSFPVILRIDDGDMGEDLQMWDVMVADNQVPDPPVPMSPVNRVYVDPAAPPTLVVENATDADGDTLVYFFRLSKTSGFDTPDVLGSGEIDEDPSGMTSWTPAEPLEEGLWYWEVWVDDGIGESAHRYAQFISGTETPAMPDAGPAGSADGGTGGVDAGPGGGDDGCRVSPGRSGSTGLVWLLGLAALALLRRRRRS